MISSTLQEMRTRHTVFVTWTGTSEDSQKDSVKKHLRLTRMAGRAKKVRFSGPYSVFRASLQTQPTTIKALMEVLLTALESDLVVTWPETWMVVMMFLAKKATQSES